MDIFGWVDRDGWIWMHEWTDRSPLSPSHFLRGNRTQSINRGTIPFVLYAVGCFRPFLGYLVSFTTQIGFGRWLRKLVACYLVISLTLERVNSVRCAGWELSLFSTRAWVSLILERVNRVLMSQLVAQLYGTMAQWGSPNNAGWLVPLPSIVPVRSLTTTGTLYKNYTNILL